MTARATTAIAVLVVLAAAIAIALPRLERTPPDLRVPAEITLGAAGQTVVITLRDDDSGLRSFSARLLHGAGSRSLVNESFPGGWLSGGASGSEERTIELNLDASALQVPDGAATLVVSARDWSWREGFRGNRSERSVPLTIDTRAPSVSVMSGVTYVYRGGSAAAIYRSSEASPQHGVRVGEAFFPGVPHPAGGDRVYLAIFAIPIDAAPDPLVEAVAIDAVGNEGRARVPAHVLERAFSKADIAIRDEFLRRVAEPLARKAGLDAPDPVTAFQRVNTELRASNEETIRQRLHDVSSQRHWRGAFEQLHGSRVMSRFAEQRTYFLRGDEISRATHFGFDLASTARAPVTAAAAGVVVSADDLGIYGNCVLIDHGIGLGSLYGHLSQIDVVAGDRVEKGQPIGLTGDTGLAAGDHLHFAVVLGGHYVDPLEWWDPKWVRSHIEVRLERTGP